MGTIRRWSLLALLVVTLTVAVVFVGGDHVDTKGSVETPSDDALWSGTNKNRDVSTGPLARPFTRSLAPDSSLRSRPPLRSLIRSLAHFAHSLARGKANF